MFIGTSLPGEYYPSLEIFSYDKLIHLGAFMGLGILTYRALRNQDRFPTLASHAFLWTVILATVYGAFDETHQIFVPGRMADVMDWLADVSGVFVAVLLEWIWNKIRPARG
jgi:VanZ family protein